MLLDVSFPADLYRRHGLGAKYYFGPNMMLITRYDFASAGHPTEKGDVRLAAQDTFWTILEATF